MPIRIFCPCDSPGKCTEVGCQPSSRGSSQPRDPTWVSPTLQVDSLSSEPPWKPERTLIGTLFNRNGLKFSLGKLFNFLIIFVIYKMGILAPSWILFWVIKWRSDIKCLINSRCSEMLLSVHIQLLVSFLSVQFSRSVMSDSLDPTNCSTPGLPVHHQLPEFTQTYVHGVGDAIQPSHPLSSPSSPALNPSQHQGLFQWVSSSHQVAKVLYKVYKLLHKDYEVPNNSSKFWRLEASFNQDTVRVSVIFFKKWFQEGGSEI